MWRYFTEVVKGIRAVSKYAGLAVVLFSILAFSASALEKWSNENAPSDTSGPVE